jgi:hypothetical protein
MAAPALFFSPLSALRGAASVFSFAPARLPFAPIAARLEVAF